MSQVVCAKDREAYSKMSQNIKAQNHYGAGCSGRDCQDSRNSSRIVKSRIVKAWDGIRIGLIKKSRFVIFPCIITVEYTCTRLGEVSVKLYVCTRSKESLRNPLRPWLKSVWWTLKEDAMILKMREDGCSWEHIHAALPLQPTGTHCLTRVAIRPSCHDGSRTARKFILSRPGAFWVAWAALVTLNPLVILHCLNSTVLKQSAAKGHMTRDICNGHVITKYP